MLISKISSVTNFSKNIFKHCTLITIKHKMFVFIVINVYSGHDSAHSGWFRSVPYFYKHVAQILNTFSIQTPLNRMIVMRCCLFLTFITWILITKQNRGFRRLEFVKL